jgi:hypothetical protein
MPPRKKPHPRSLDALFGPKPRTVAKAPVRRCQAGHKQAPTWTTRQPCFKCEEARAREELERRALPPLGPVPDVLRVRVVDTGRVITYAIPPHLQRRGPRPRRRI